MPLPTITRIKGRVTQLEASPFAEDILTDTVNAAYDISVAKARIGDVVNISHDDEATEIEVNAYVSANGVVTVQFVNSTAGTLSYDTGIAYLTVFHRK